MRTRLLLALMILTTTLKAQTFLPQSFTDNNYRSGIAYSQHVNDSIAQNKWFFTRYSALSTSYSFFRGGHAIVIAAPVGLQLNHRLTDNLYAFANVTIAPAYINFRRSFMGPDFKKNTQSNNLFKSGGLGMLGLMYINAEKNFSVSGSISVERNAYPILPYYYPNYQNPSYKREGANKK